MRWESRCWSWCDMAKGGCKEKYVQKSSSNAYVRLEHVGPVSPFEMVLYWHFLLNRSYPASNDLQSPPINLRFIYLVKISGVHLSGWFACSCSIRKAVRASTMEPTSASQALYELVLLQTIQHTRTVTCLLVYHCHHRFMRYCNISRSLNYNCNHYGSSYGIWPRCSGGGYLASICKLCWSGILYQSLHSNLYVYYSYWMGRCCRSKITVPFLVTYSISIWQIQPYQKDKSC